MPSWFLIFMFCGIIATAGVTVYRKNKTAAPAADAVEDGVPEKEGEVSAEDTKGEPIEETAVSDTASAIPSVTPSVVPSVTPSATPSATPLSGQVSKAVGKPSKATVVGEKKAINNRKSVSRSDTDETSSRV